MSSLKSVPLTTDPPAGDDDTLLATLADLHRTEQSLAARKLAVIAELDHRKAHTGRARDTADLLTHLLS
jgi:hypothetical protein